MGLTPLLSKTDQLRTRLAQTEADLRAAKAKAEIISLEDSKRAYVEQINKLRQGLFDAEAELEERKAALSLLGTAGTNTNNVATAEVPVPADQIDAYRDICTQLSAFRTNRTALLTKYREDTTVIKQVNQEISQLEARKLEMEKAYPALLASGVSTIAIGIDYAAEMTRIRALEARINVLNTHLAKVRSDVARLDQAESDIVRLQRQKEVDESNFKHYSANLEQARVDETLIGVGRITNITTVQEPSPPARDASMIMKPVAASILGGLGLGLGLALLLEFVLNHAIRRPGEIESKFRLPLFLTIPDFSPRRALPGLRLMAKLPLIRKLIPASSIQYPVSNISPSPLDSGHSSLYLDSLRDRLITWFDAQALAHKPKLVAVTSCSRGAGVTSLASGLAASLSEVGGGNVLLVDMDHDRAAAHPFLNGKAACPLHEALEEAKPDATQENSNLYVASANGAPDNLPKAMPKRFAQLMPKMKASDYDYIVFDMPPVNQTSVTPRVANHMDIVLMVVESEHTSREAVKRGLAALAESKAPVAAVLNKTRSYLPSWLQHDDV